MEIVREFKTPVSQQIILDIPAKFVEEELEILIIPVNNSMKKKTTKKNKHELFDNLCGLWEGRDDVTVESIRNKAWKRD